MVNLRTRLAWSRPSTFRAIKTIDEIAFQTSMPPSRRPGGGSWNGLRGRGRRSPEPCPAQRVRPEGNPRSSAKARVLELRRGAIPELKRPTASNTPAPKPTEDSFTSFEEPAGRCCGYRAKLLKGAPNRCRHPFPASRWMEQQGPAVPAPPFGFETASPLPAEKDPRRTIRAVLLRARERG